MTAILIDAETLTPGVEIPNNTLGLTINKVGSGSFQATATNPIRGTQSLLVGYPASGDVVTVIYSDVTNPTQQRAAIEFNFTAAPTADIALHTFYSAAGTGAGGCVTVTMRATGRLQIGDAAGTTQYVTPATGGVITFPRTGTIDVAIDIGSSTTTGKFQCDVYLHDVSTVTPWQSSGEVSGLNLFRTGAVGSHRFGKLSGTAVGSHRLDQVRLNDGYALQGVYSVPMVNVASVIDSTGWVALGGTTILANISDTDSATGAIATNPSNLPIRLQLPGLVQPTSNFTAVVEAFRGGGASSASITGALYYNGTLMATSDTKNPTTSNSPFTLTWTLASMSSITSAMWAAGLELRITGSAA